MKWTKEADEAMAKVPFFARKRVRKRVEEEAARRGDGEVRLEHVRTCQRRFLEKMEEEVKGYQVEGCFGPNGCPYRAVGYKDIFARVEERLAGRNIRSFLKERVQGPLKMHHEFRVSISDCPNACSRPQIADLGLIGARKPAVSNIPCNHCGACVEVCRENAIRLEADGPAVDFSKCLACGQCLGSCPTGTLQEGERGYRILAGGKLGRHPRLGREFPGIFSPEGALEAVDRCLDHYQKNCSRGERFGEILERTGIKKIIDRGRQTDDRRKET
jgi:anaerobic sulfite reductase subunit C